MEIGHFTWLRTHRARYNLASSGVVPIRLSEVTNLGRPGDMLSELINVYGVGEGNIAITHGAQEANAVALLVLRGLATNGVVTVIPEYEPIRVLPRFLGLRQVEVNVEESLMEALNAVKPGMVLLLSNPNNPTGMFLGRKMLWELSDTLRRINSYAILDSIFLEFVEEDLRGLPMENVVYTFSTSKFYTMSELKVGWVVGDGELIKRIKWVMDLINPLTLDLDLGYASILIRNRAWVRGRNLGIIRPNVEVFRSVIKDLGGKVDVSYVEYMPILYLRLRCRGLSGMMLASRLLERDVLVVPGLYFGRDDGVRVGLGSVDRGTFEAAMNIMVNVINQECEGK